MKRSTVRLTGMIGVAVAAWAVSGWGAGTDAATDAIASVIAIRGKVEATGADGAVRTLALKSPLYRKDTLRTSERGRVQIGFDDETLISLGRNTTMSLDEFEFDPSANKGKLVTSVEEGVFRVMGGAITKIAPENFKTVTPTATIGIRGSFYLGSVLNDVLKVIFLGGKGIDVYNALGRVEITDASFGTMVPSPRQEPQKGVRFSSDDIRGLMKEFAFQGGLQDGGGAPGAQPKEGAAPDGNPRDDRSSQGASVPGKPVNLAGVVGGNQPGDGKDWGLMPIDNRLPEGGDWLSGKSSAIPPDRVLSGLSGGTGGFGELVKLPENLRDNLSGGSQTNILPTGDFDQPYPMTGAYLAARVPPGGRDSRAGEPGQTWRGAVDGKTVAGVVRGQTALSEGTGAFPLEFPTVRVPPTNTAALYRGVASVGGAVHKRDVFGANTVADVAYEYRFDNLGEAALFWATPQTVRNDVSDSYTFAELGMLGVRSNLMPADGQVALYALGKSLRTEQAGADVDLALGDLALAVNRLNGKVIGYTEDELMTGGRGAMYTYGDIGGSVTATGGSGGGGNEVGRDGAAPVTLKCLGVESVSGAAGAPLAFENESAQIEFFGREQQAVGLVAQGVTRDVTGTGAATDMGVWRQTAGAFLLPGRLVPANTGADPIPWQGFAVGAPQGLGGAGVYGETLMNRYGEAGEGFGLNITPGTGDVSGSMSLTQALDATPNLALTNVEIGGDHGSAYVSDDILVAELGGTDVVRKLGAPSAQGDLKPGATNLLATAKLEDQTSEWTTWGYWSATFDRPGGGGGQPDTRFRDDGVAGPEHHGDLHRRCARHDDQWQQRPVHEGFIEFHRRVCHGKPGRLNELCDQRLAEHQHGGVGQHHRGWLQRSHHGGQRGDAVGRGIHRRVLRYGRGVNGDNAARRRGWVVCR
ncbi:MAG: hypothetical protein A3K18_28050 [Lentisphaerae bacterium RIFOXYA12_64_32]|nr:MAG: hypothetical protein A3K18_28050 [Lentisphaerae bacterium RIFOXYA12_64_32]